MANEPAGGAEADTTVATVGPVAETLAGSAPPTTPDEDLRRVIERGRRLPWAAILAGAVIVWVPFKLLRVTHQEPAMALAVARSSDQTTMLLGLAIVSVIPILVLAFALACHSTRTQFSALVGHLEQTRRPIGPAAAAPNSRPVRGTVASPATTASGATHDSTSATPSTSSTPENVAIVQRRLLWTAASAATAAGVWILTLLTQPVYVSVTAPVIAMLLLIGDRRASGRLEAWVDGRITTPRRAVFALLAAVTGGTVILGGLVVWTALNDSMWLPAERIVVDGTVDGTVDGEDRDPPSGRSTGVVESGSLVGYVVDESNERLLVLRDSDRRLIAVEQERVASRDFCSISAPGETRTLLDLFTDREAADIPDC